MPFLAIPAVAVLLFFGVNADWNYAVNPEDGPTVGALSVLKVSQGGTGAASFTEGECIVGHGTGPLTSQACGGGEGNFFAYPFPAGATSSPVNFTGGLSLNSWKTSTSTVVCKESAFCQYTTIQSAIDAGWTSIFVKNGVYSEQINLSAAKTQIVGESLNAIIQCNGVTQSPCVTADTDEFKIANLTIRETNGVWSGTGIDFSNTALGLIDGVRINNFATSTRAVDSTSNTFYNKIQNSTFFNPKTCIELSGSQANANWSAWNRCRPAQVSGTGFGVYLSDVRGFTSIADDFEGTTTSNGVTGIYVDATSREISFTNPWVEANQTGINVASGANRVTFTGGSITSNGTDITDNGTNTVFINTSDTGVLVNKFGYASTTALNVGADFVADLDGAGLTLSAAGVLSATLGTAIDISGETNLTGGLGLTLTDDDMACDTATGAVFGCLSAADFTTFNNKVSSTSIDTVGELQTLVGGQNILLETEIDACSELLALLDDETGTCGGAVFSVGPTLTGVTTMANASTTLFSSSYASSTRWAGGGLADCDADGQTVSYDITTMQFGCGDDDGGAGGTPGGNTTEIQFNDAGAFAGDTALVWDKDSDILSLSNLRLLSGTVRITPSSGDVAGGSLDVLAGNGDSVSGNANGGALNLTAGSGAATSGDGGNVVITPGSPLGTGVSGRIILDGNASSTLFSANYASSTKWWGGGLLSTCASGSFLTWTAGVFGCDTDDNTTYTAGDNLTLTGTDFDLDASLTGLTGIVSTGLLDFGGSVLEISNGTNPTADDVGELAHDTTDNQLILDDLVVAKGTNKIWSATIASTSPAFISGGLMPFPIQLDGYTITAIRCYVVSGTSKVIAVEDASANSSEDITCGTTATSDDGSITNASYTAAELGNIDFGASTGAVDYVSISVFGTWARE
jgi:hypothetical protein